MVTKMVKQVGGQANVSGIELLLNLVLQPDEGYHWGCGRGTRIPGSLFLSL
jgi:hypothetical protein